MSADVKSVPPWKLALLEKKRRQEEEDRYRRQEEEQRINRMPAWKRDILIKKQQQKNSLVFFAKPGEVTVSGKRDSPRQPDSIQTETSNVHTAPTNDSPVNVTNHHIDSATSQSAVSMLAVKAAQPAAGTGEAAGPSEEHIIPIQQNPWLRTDKRQRPHQTHKRYSTGSDHSDNVMAPNAYNSLPRSQSSSCWKGPADDNDGEDEIFNDDQEVAYGRGFVHKLLKKFKHLSARDDRLSPSAVSVGPKRSHSSENILEEVHGSGKGSPRNYSTSGVEIHDGRPTGIYASPTKARSMENLSGGKVINLDSVKVHGSEIQDSIQGSLDESFSSAGGSVQSPRGGSVSSSDMLNHINWDEDGDVSLTDTPVKGELTLPEGSYALRRHSSSENLIEDELPRANIVSSTRSIFETVSGTLTLNRGNKKRMAPVPGSESPRDASVSLPNGSVSHSELETKDHKHSSQLSSADETAGIQKVGRVLYSSLQGSEGEAGDGVSVQPRDTHHVNSKGKTGNDRNANYKSDNSSVLVENRTGSGAPAVTGQRANQSFLPTAGSNLAQDGHYWSSAGPTSNSIMQKNNQNNNRTSSQTSPTNGTSEIISTDQDSHKDQLDLANSSKKRRAPLPPSSSSTSEATIKHPDVTRSVSDTNTADGPKNTDNRFKPNAEPKKPNLHLDFTSESRGQKQVSAPQSPSYRDLYFSSSSSSKGTPVNHASTVNHSTSSNTELINTDLSGSHRNGVLESNNVRDQPSSSSTSISQTSGKLGSPSKKEPAKPIPSPSSVQKIPSRTPNITSNIRPNQSSKPANGHAAALTLPIPKAGEGPVTRKVDGVKKGKRQNSTPSGNAGSLLIRPASNLVPGSANKNTQYANIKKYNDVKTGVFEPAQLHPSYLDGLEDEYDVPITNIDDVLDYLPVTDIDDISGNSHSSPRFEQDADRERRILSSRYDFIGAGVTTSKNLLVKTRQEKLRISFNDAATSTYEYPSEQSLLEEMPPEPGDFDYIQQLHGKNHANPEEPNIDDLISPVGAPLKSTPGMGPGGGLASYRSRFSKEYEFGMDLYPENREPSKPETKTEEPEDLQIKPATDDEGHTWSGTQSSDILF